MGEGGAFLGKISRNKYDRESLANEYGAGSKYKTDGLFNEYGKFGGRYQLNSAFNSYSQTPPKILYERNGELYIVGYLTTNRSFKTANHRFSPHDLKAWINEK